MYLETFQILHLLRITDGVYMKNSLLVWECRNFIFFLSYFIAPVYIWQVWQVDIVHLWLSTYQGSCAILVDFTKVLRVKGKASISTDDLVHLDRLSWHMHPMTLWTLHARTDFYILRLSPRTDLNEHPTSLLFSVEDSEECVARLTNLVRPFNLHRCKTLFTRGLRFAPDVIHVFTIYEENA